MNVDFSNFNTMNGGENPFEKKEYFTDERFYTLKKDEKGNGAAVLRFLPSELHENGTMSTVKKVFRYNIQSKTSKRFISEWSPSTIGLPDPIQEKWAKLYNSGQKDESRRYARSTRYIANVKVLKDPANPENEGKIFLLDMSQTLADKVQSIINPSEQDQALGTKPKNLFDPINGYSFKLISTKGANGFIEYSRSDALENPSSIYANVEEAVNDIKNNCHKLSDWDKPESYKSYEQIKELLDGLDVATENDSVNVENVQNVQTSQVSFTQNVQPNVTQTSQATQATQTAKDEKVQPAKVADDLDTLLDELSK